ncbi:MAG: response regulator [Patescibacteria group bacterium]|jgi:CheY-like chemotaxis protein
MKVLVIDDQKRNIASAQKLEEHGHDVVAVSTVQEAEELLTKCLGNFDAVLTDLHMPVGQFTGAMARSIPAPKEEIPVGLVFAITAANFGIRTVICTDSNHHRDWICTLLDMVHYTGDSAVRKVAFVEARCCPLEAYYDEETQNLVGCDLEQLNDKPVVKDWFRAMRRSGLFPELIGAK